MKALSRRAEAHLAGGDCAAAQADVRRAIGMEPRNRELRAQLRRIKTEAAAADKAFKPLASIMSKAVAPEPQQGSQVRAAILPCLHTDPSVLTSDRASFVPPLNMACLLPLSWNRAELGGFASTSNFLCNSLMHQAAMEMCHLDLLLLSLCRGMLPARQL